MLKQRARTIAFVIFLLDLGVTCAAFAGAYLLRSAWLAHALRKPLYPFSYYLNLLLFILPVWALSFWISGLYRSHRTSSLLRESWQVTRAVSAGGLTLIMALFLIKATSISRLLILIFLFLNAMLLALFRAGVRLVGRRVRSRGYNFRGMLIVGTGDRAAHFARMIAERPWWGYLVAGFIDPDGGQGQDVDGDRILGHIADLPRLLQELVIDEVVFVVPPDKLALFEKTFLLCEEVGVKTRVVLEYLPRQMATVQVEMVEGLPVMSFSTGPVNLTALAIKKVIDVLLSAILLIFLAPFLLLIALAVKLSSRGPVLFRQIRVGLNGRRFTLYKFRSMYRDAEQRKGEVAHLNEMDGPVFKVRDDPRVTPVGRFLRSFSLDELPQLFNILKGDMSFVGPRPPLPEEVSQYQHWQRRRLSMRPGLTCLWQIAGRNTVDFNTWMRLDLEYIDRWSLWLDLKIFCRTIPIVLTRHGAM